MTIKRRKRNSKVLFRTPEEFEQGVMDYLDEVDNLNKPRFVVIDIETGDEYPSKEDARKAGVAEAFIKGEFEKVPVYDIVKPTVTGFCSFWGISMGQYRTMEQYDEEFMSVSEWFHTMLEEVVQQLLLNPANRNAQGAKFVAVNKFGWSDKSEVEHSGSTGIELIYDIPMEVSDDEKNKSED